MVRIYSRFDVPLDEGIFFEDESLAQQHFKDECDINNILAKYNRTGLLPQVSEQFEFGDFGESFDYQASLNKMIEAQAIFDALPSQIRREFNNNVGEFLEQVHNEDFFDRGVEIGLFAPRPQVVENTGEIISSKPSLDIAAE